MTGRISASSGLLSQCRPWADLLVQKRAGEQPNAATVSSFETNRGPRWLQLCVRICERATFFFVNFVDFFWLATDPCFASNFFCLRAFLRLTLALAAWRSRVWPDFYFFFRASIGRKGTGWEADNCELVEKKKK